MAIQEYKNHIRRDTNVLDENVYIEANGRGQGCGTVWFKTVEQAQKFIDKYGFGFDIPKELCLKCQCNYSNTDPKFRFLLSHICNNYKEDIANNL